MIKGVKILAEVDTDREARKRAKEFIASNDRAKYPILLDGFWKELEFAADTSSRGGSGGKPNAMLAETVGTPTGNASSDKEMGQEEPLMTLDPLKAPATVKAGGVGTGGKRWAPEEATPRKAIKFEDGSSVMVARLRKF